MMPSQNARETASERPPIGRKRGSGTQRAVGWNDSRFRISGTQLQVLTLLSRPPGIAAGFAKSVFEVQKSLVILFDILFFGVDLRLGGVKIAATVLLSQRDVRIAVVLLLLQ